MLKDRRILVEKDIVTLTRSAAILYLEIVKGDQAQYDEYDRLVSNLVELEIELKLINQLISDGHE